MREYLGARHLGESFYLVMIDAGNDGSCSDPPTRCRGLFHLLRELVCPPGHLPGGKHSCRGEGVRAELPSIQAKEGRLAPLANCFADQ